MMACTDWLKGSNVYGTYKDVGIYDNRDNDKFAIVKIRSHSEFTSEQPLLRLILNRMRTNEPMETKTDQVPKEIKSEVKDDFLKVDTASQERSILVVPFKKRRHVEPLADENLEPTICTMEKEQVLKQSVAIEKAHKPKAMSSDKPDDKKKRRDKKKQQHKQQQPKAELPQLTNEPSSSRKMHGPCEDGACAGTFACDDTESVSPTKQSSLDEFWLEEITKSFNKCEYSKVLHGTKFTKEQRDILRQSFTQLSRKMSNIQTNSHRFLKTHKCKRCEFSISHQCMPLDFIRSVPFGVELMDQAYVGPGQTVVCDCGFAFSHAHLKRMRHPVKLGYVERNTPHLQLYNRSVDVSCAKCYTKIVMNNSANNVCCDLATWDSIAGDDRESFYAGIQGCFHYSGTTALSLDEFIACSKGCCLIFHRCSGKVEAPGASSSSPG